MDEFVAGAVGGASGLLVGHPLEVLKVQLQVANGGGGGGGGGLRRAIRGILDRGLVQGVFRGLSFPMASFTAVNAVFFGCYSNCLALLEAQNPGGHYRNVFIAGMAGGAAQLPLLNPVEVVKTSMQAQITSSRGGAQFYRGPLHCAGDIVRSRGLAGLARGLGVTFLRDVPSFGLYMASYELLLRLLDPAGAGAAWPQLLAGGTAGSLCWLSVTPFDVVKSNLQADASGASTWRSVVRRVHSEAGLRGFFKGASVVALRAFPVNAVTFFAWSRTLQALKAAKASA